MDLKSIVQRFFEIYPDKDTLYATQDGNVFLNKSDAANHARSLKENYFEFERGAEEHTEKTGDQDEKNQELKQEALTIDLETGTYKDKTRILKGLKLQPESWKAVDVNPAFANLVAELKAAAELPSQTEVNPADETGSTETPATPAV
jgi:hypothetical protein